MSLCLHSRILKSGCKPLSCKLIIETAHFHNCVDEMSIKGFFQLLHSDLVLSLVLSGKGDKLLHGAGVVAGLAALPHHDTTVTCGHASSAAAKARDLIPNNHYP